MTKMFKAISICGAICCGLFLPYAGRIAAHSTKFNETGDLTRYFQPLTLPQPGVAIPQSPATTPRDGQHDFDFELGSWKIHLKKLMHPMTGSTTWVEFDGTSVTRKVWDGRSQLEKFETDSPTAGHIEGLTLRLYNPQAHQWNINWATAKSGTFGQPTIGEFKNGRGEFYDYEPIDDRMILVRFVWTNTATAPHFEQSFSDDGGKTWEVNWITDQTRVKDEVDKGH